MQNIIVLRHYVRNITGRENLNYKWATNELANTL